MNTHERIVYDAALAGEEPVACPICTGDSDADPCSEECAIVATRANNIAAIHRLYARVAVVKAYGRAYRSLGGRRDPRLPSIIGELLRLRRQIRVLRQMNATLLRHEDVDTVLAVTLGEELAAE